MAKPDLWSCTKFKRLCRDLAIPRAHVVGLLETLWHSAYAASSDLVGDSDDVELAAEWEGDSGTLTSALVNNRFLDLDDGLYYVHDLSDHAPEYVRKRLKRRKNKDLHQKTADNGGQRQTMEASSPQNGALPTHPTHPTIPIPPPATVSETREVSQKQNNSNRFAPPTVDEVIQYGVQICLPEDECRAFWNYYESNGWRVGKNGMKKWRCAVAGWHQRWRANGGTPKQKTGGIDLSWMQGTKND